jgi:RimJ/RimL family protein N-acetyltransferase
MKLKVLSMEDCEQVRLWRNECLYALRTPHPSTKEQQEEFYLNVVCDKNTNSLYRGVTTEIGKDDETIDMLIGMVGLENIEKENGRAEISIMINPEYQQAGFGWDAMEALLKLGFTYERIENIWGECYTSNPAINFWRKICKRYNAYTTMMKNTKLWDDVYHDSLLFNFNKEDWEACRK